MGAKLFRQVCLSLSLPQSPQIQAMGQNSLAAQGCSSIDEPQATAQI